MDNNDLTYTPSAKVILPHYYTGAVIFLISAILILLSAESFTGHYFSPHLLSITHLLVLGWGTMIIFGALYQILPVILEVPLYSEKLAIFSYITLLAGALTIGCSFWHFEIAYSLPAGGVMILTSVTIFLLNVFATSKKARQLKTDSEFILTATIWLWLTASAGTLLAFNLRGAFLPDDHLTYLKVHAHLGLAGWFLMLIMGVASRLVPMFLVSQVKDERFLNLSYYLVNLGLAGFTVNLIMIRERSLSILCALMIAGSIICFLIHLIKVYNNRVRKVLDQGMKQSMLAFASLLLPVFIGFILLVLNKNQSSISATTGILYGMTIILSFISGLILGKTYKTLPFILLLQINRNRKRDKPLKIKQQDLYSGKIATAQFICFIIGLLIMLTGTALKKINWIESGALVLCISAVLYNITLVQMLMGYIKNKGSHGTFK